MADTLVKKPKLIVGTQAQVKSEMGENDIGFATDVEFYTAKQIDELLEKSGGASLPILMRMWSDHVINDMSWLRADTFSWQSGDTYKSAYEHLADDLGEVEILYCWGGDVFTKTPTPNIDDRLYRADGTDLGSHVDYTDNDHSYIISSDGVAQLSRDESGDLQLPKEKSPQTDTIGDITITYYEADDGHKICLPDQESNIVALYEKTGAADYYLLDTANKQFKLPRKQKRTLIQAVKNTDGTWFNLYSNGWVEQGGETTTGGTITLPVEMSDTHYTVTQGIKYTADSSWSVGSIRPASTTTVNVNKANGDASWWHVCGYAAESTYASAGMNLEYYYVGNFSQEAVEQTAGLNSELFNDKADRNLLNTTDNVDIVVESQLPTETNGYTWYRKYKSGWVEQGGVVAISTAGAATNVTFPIEMKDINYSALGNRVVRATSGTNYQASVAFSVYQTTGMKVHCGTGNNAQVAWQVSGMAA